MNSVVSVGYNGSFLRRNQFFYCVLFFFKDLSDAFCLHSMINADFCVAGCLIAYGALLGKVSPVQLMVLTLFGVTLFAVEEYIILNLIKVIVFCVKKAYFALYHYRIS